MKKFLWVMASLMRVIIFYIGVKITGMAKMSYIVGSYLAFFSASNIFYPVAGIWLGISGSCLCFAMRAIMRFLAGTPFYFNLLYGIPGLFSALYMTSSHALIRLIIPLICMVLFLAHPTGFSAAPYTFYWLLPIVIYFFRKKTLFIEALGATFVAHAVGSVCWLYLIPMPVEYWWKLIPIVAIERLSFATGVVIVYSGYKYGRRIVNGLSWKVLFSDQCA